MRVENSKTVGNSAIAGFSTSLGHTFYLGLCVNKDLSRQVSSPIESKSRENMMVEVMDYFNEQTDSRRNASAVSTVSLLDKLFDKGYTVEDIKVVIRHKSDEWKNVSSMRKYLKPQTLFDVANFKGYLAETKTIGL